MGQCVTVEVSSSKNQHSPLSKQHESQKALHQKGTGKKLRKQESSDEETSDDAADIEREALENFSKDPNFGQQQSPINVITKSGQPNCAVKNEEKFDANPLNINYPPQIRGCTIMNTGHTVQVNVPEHANCTLDRNGKTYRLVQFHFHTPAEHLIDSRQYEMEMHLVHATEEGELGVIGFIFTTKIPYFKRTMKLERARQFLVNKTQQIIMNYGKQEDPVNQDQDQEQVLEDEDEDKEEEEVDQSATCIPIQSAEERRRSSVRQLKGNDFLAQFFDQLPLTKTTEDILLDGPISFDYLFEAASKTFKRRVEDNRIVIDMEFFEYDGGLTTPPYSEGVQWMLAKELHFINAKQLNKLSSAWGHHPNARDCQQYCGRTVELRTCACMKGYFFN